MTDRSTVFIWIAVAGLLAWAAISGLGTGAVIFWRGSSAALVIGGALLTTIIACPTVEIKAIPGLLRKALSRKPDLPEGTIVTLVALADTARREGLLSLEKPVAALQDGFLKRAMLMAIDGADPRTIESVMQAEMESLDLRHSYGRSWFETMGRIAPALGMVGTLIGLVVMLVGMQDPESLGPGMAVALLTTLYGLMLGNLVCFPLARRLAQHNSEELLNKTIALKGVLAVQAGDNPRVVAEKLRVYLPGSRGRSDIDWSAIVDPNRLASGEAVSASGNRDQAREASRSGSRRRVKWSDAA